MKSNNMNMTSYYIYPLRVIVQKLLLRTNTTMTKSPDPKLAERKIPSQDRSRQRVNLILETAKSILREQGLNSFTTAEIATRAEIPVGSIYQYYPNKKSILLALFENYLHRIREVFAEFDDPKYLQLGWEECAKQLFEAIHRTELQDHIEDELDRALVLFPELATVDRQHRELIADLMSSFFLKMGARWSRPKLRRLSLFLYAINGGIWSYRTDYSPPKKELAEWESSVTMAILRKCFEE
jgi:AcrR family transcriptional regulator